MTLGDDESASYMKKKKPNQMRHRFLSCSKAYPGLVSGVAPKAFSKIKKVSSYTGCSM